MAIKRSPVIRIREARGAAVEAAVKELERSDDRRAIGAALKRLGGLYMAETSQQLEIEITHE
jgi:hypothetical protein